MKIFQLNFVYHSESSMLFFRHNVKVFLINLLFFTSRIMSLHPWVVPIWVDFLARYIYLSMVDGEKCSVFAEAHLEKRNEGTHHPLANYVSTGFSLRISARMQTNQIIALEPRCCALKIRWSIFFCSNSHSVQDETLASSVLRESYQPTHNGYPALSILDVSADHDLWDSLNCRQFFYLHSVWSL